MTTEDLPEFPDEFLKPRDAFIYGKPGEWAILIGLEPFELDGETVKTKISFDPFPWGVAHPRELAGSAYQYSAEERGGSNIDASIYLRDAHHPVDVMRVSFGNAMDDELQVDIEFAFDFSVEGGGFQNRSARITCRLKCKEPRGVLSYRIIKK